MYNQKEITVIHDAGTIVWLAGLLEGEGSFILCRGRISITLVMTDLDVVQKVASLMDAPCHQQKPRQAHHKIAYYCRVTGARAAYYMRLILPYMGERRASKIQECLSYFEMAIEQRIERLKKRTSLISDEQLRTAWLTKSSTQSLRDLARNLGVDRESLRKRLIKMGFNTSRGLTTISKNSKVAQEATNPLGIPLLESDKQFATGWMAGILEGEGCFYNGKCIAINLQMTDEDIIQRFCEITNSKYVAEEPRRKNWKRLYRVSIKGSRAAYYMEQVLPFMGIRRSSKIQECLATRQSQEEARQLRADQLEARLPSNEVLQRWINRKQTDTLRSIALEMKVHPESLKRKLVKLGVYDSPIYK